MNKHEDIIKCEARIQIMSDLRDNIEMAFDEMPETTRRGPFEDGFNYAYGIIMGLIDKTLEELSWEDTAAREGI